MQASVFDTLRQISEVPSSLPSSITKTSRFRYDCFKIESRHLKIVAFRLYTGTITETNGLPIKFIYTPKYIIPT